MITALPYDPSHASRWDQLVDGSAHGTWQHSRRFLDYHRDRFEEASLVLVDDRERWVGVCPAVVSPQRTNEVVSHLGATYGGLVPGSAGVSVGVVHEMLDAIRDHHARHGRRSLVYKAVPPHLVQTPLQSDVHALWLRGAELVRRDLWNAFPTDGPHKLSRGHKRWLSKARKAALVVETSNTDEAYCALHAMVDENLRAQHDTTAVHTLEDLLDLRARLGEAVSLTGVRSADGSWQAMTWVFKHPRAWHTQYIASTAEGREVGATVLLFERLIAMTQDADVPWFSFGASTTEGGRAVNAGLYQHKASFGHGAVVADHYRWAW